MCLSDTNPHEFLEISVILNIEITTEFGKVNNLNQCKSTNYTEIVKNIRYN
jgi:hypothetical protein